MPVLVLRGKENMDIGIPTQHIISFHYIAIQRGKLVQYNKSGTKWCFHTRRRLNRDTKLNKEGGSFGGFNPPVIPSTTIRKEGLLGHTRVF